ncbi:hypothetical protein Leryth_012315 [Lithospermum erythrorhizon]|nr:hypothetical protein Leryth_012315 [Lithospermum erythrorhizon]
MATTRLMFRTSPSQHFLPSFHHVNAMNRIIIISKQRFNGSSSRPPGTERHPIPTSPNALLASAVQTNTSASTLDFSLLFAIISNVILHKFKVVTRRNPWKLYIQMFVEKVIVDCRFFTLFAVAGSMIGSVLCFMEGCFLVVESYLQYFHALAQRSDQGHIMQLLIESIDMFLIGAAMLTFGMSLYGMFVGSNRDIEGFPSWVRVHSNDSIMQVKSRIGHAVMLLLQVGVLEKFKNIPVLTGFDLACFAAAVFASSASTFLLSRLALAHNTTTHA